MVCKLFDKKPSGSGIKNHNMSDQPRKAHSPFIDNIWGVDLADIKLISKVNNGICFSLSAIDVFSKYAWNISLKDKKGVNLLLLFKISQSANQIKYGLIKAENLTIHQWNHG